MFYVLYWISAYPDYSDGGSFITGIEIMDSKNHFHGISFYSSYVEFGHVFEKGNFIISQEEHMLHSARKGSVCFRYKTGAYFKVSAVVGNRNNIVFDDGALWAGKPWLFF